MASTNKTANLGLSQWQAKDAFTAEGMNGDLRLIDAAFDHRPEILLLRALTIAPEKGSVEMAEVDLSDINFGEFYFFIIEIGWAENADMYFNGEKLTSAPYRSMFYFAPMKRPNVETLFLRVYDTTLSSGQISTRYGNINKLGFYKNGTAFNSYTELRIWGVK